jgi:hypothetical protein
MSEEEQPKQYKIGMVLVENPDAKEVYLYLVQVNDDNKPVSTLGVSAKAVFEYLTQFQDKFMPKKNLDGVLRDMVR